MKPSTTHLTPRQEKALTALLTEVTIEAAAKRAGISDVTLWRWLQEPLFQAHYQQARRQIVGDAVGLLQRASKKAVATLVKNLDCGLPSVEVAAARVILEQAYKGVELLELEERITGLEENLPEKADDRQRY